MEQFGSMIQAGAVGLLIIFAGMIKIPPIQLNFWGWLGKIVGRSINGEVLERVNKLTTDFEELKEREELNEAKRARQHVLRFNDEILCNQRHTKEHFDEILEDIDIYEKYCNQHKDYENNRAELAISTIEEVYKECLQTHDFLTQTRKKD